MHSRLVLKIPISLGESGSHNNSPKISRSPKVQSKHSSSVDHLPTVVTSNGTSSKKFDENDEEVRSKPRKRNVSSSASCSAVGVKSIADILNSADEQLKLSRVFAEKMAIRRCVSLRRLHLLCGYQSLNVTPVVFVLAWIAAIVICVNYCSYYYLKSTCVHNVH